MGRAGSYRRRVQQVHTYVGVWAQWLWLSGVRLVTLMAGGTAKPHWGRPGGVWGLGSGRACAPRNLGLTLEAGPCAQVRLPPPCRRRLPTTSPFTRTSASPSAQQRRQTPGSPFM